jgi:CHAT domain-containing protein
LFVPLSSYNLTFDQKSNGRNRPRIQWYACGQFSQLPLHAAGIYNGPRPVSTSDYAVSSYMPSLTSVIKARDGWTPISRAQLKVFVAAEPNASNLPKLPSVMKEVEAVTKLIATSDATLLTDRTDLSIRPSVQSVTEALPQAHIFHLSCHGRQEEDPLKSHFVLHDGMLTMAEISKLKLANATLAFLSACETAKGDRRQPDQAVHLAASMLFCGFRSVIATMW